MDRDTSTTAPALSRKLWSAAGLTRSSMATFAKACEAGEERRMLTEYFRLTHYYARTLMLCRESFENRNERLAVATLTNLLSLDSALSSMHKMNREVIPMALPLTEAFRNRFIRGLIVVILRDAPRGLCSEDITRRLSSNTLVGKVDENDVAARLEELIDNTTIRCDDGRYTVTPGQPVDISSGNAVLTSLFGAPLATAFQKNGFDKPEAVLSRRIEFRRTFTHITGLNEHVAVLVCEVLLAFVDELSAMAYRWRIRDLIHSGIPRPYQLQAYAIFRGYGYQNVLIEAPTGSGKTLIGMMCIQDWLRSLSPGQTILILVPTVNYQQQWVKELCYGKIGLGMPPEHVFAGTPAGLARYRRRVDEIPAITILTYVGSTAFASGADLQSFIRDYNVRHVVLDEAHKIADDLESGSAQTVAALVAACDAKTLNSVIGFSGTAAGYRDHFQQLGLRLVHSIPLPDLIAAGYVAPFCEYGVPFAYSEREYGILKLLESYKNVARQFIHMLGHQRLRSEFAAVPMALRIQIARDILGMYSGRSNRDHLIETRMASWENKSEIALSDMPLLTIVQIATRRADSLMVSKADRKQFTELLDQAAAIRDSLKASISLPHFVSILSTDSFGRTFGHETLTACMEKSSRLTRSEIMTILATTIGGLYDGLSDWCRYTGEGRVAAINAIIAAERKTRKLSGIIVFDHGKRLRVEESAALMPGYSGVGGLFAQIIGTDGVTPIAALSDEVYLPAVRNVDICECIIAMIRDSILCDEMAGTIVNLFLAGLDVGSDFSRRFNAAFREQFATFIGTVLGTGASSSVQFDAAVLSPLRHEFGRRRPGVSPDLNRQIRDRLRIRNPHLRSLLITCFDYAAIIRLFDRALATELIQANGKRQSVFIIRMPSGRRKQLMYDLVARLIDDSTVPFNTIIVSSWARTGWNVIRPNLLIDATATRDVVAWQQLRGRAMRARRTWTNSCCDAVTMLARPATEPVQLDQSLPPDVHTAYQELLQGIKAGIPATDAVNNLIQKVLTESERKKHARSTDFNDFTTEEKLDLAVRIMLHYNKVTHIYELVKATGSPSQLSFVRSTGTWRRSDAIAAKHDHELSVELQSGTLQCGDVHAPLLYHSDPRHDLPNDLSATIRTHIDDTDPRIVKAWMRHSGETTHDSRDAS